MTNEELLAQAQDLIQKSIVTTTALASAGKLNPEQANRFIDYVIDVTMLRGNVRVARFSSESLDIDKIGVGSRVTVPAIEAQAPTIRRGVTATKITLTPKELMTPFEITDNFLEINIEGENVEETIVRMMATQTANDIEELLINGDALGHARLESDLIENGSSTQYIKDTFMALFDGWLRLADSGNIYDAAGADVSSTVFSRMINKMPVKFRRIRRDLRFLSSLDHEQLYREKLASRATGAGDVALQSQGALTPFGVPLVGVPLLDSIPLVVEHFSATDAPYVATLRYAPIDADVVVALQTLNQVPTAAFIEATDYNVDRTAGTVTTIDAAALDLASEIKITYQSKGQFLFTNYQNLIFGIGRDIRIEQARDIFKRTNQYAITTKVDAKIEEATAMVKGINIGTN